MNSVGLPTVSVTRPATCRDSVLISSIQAADCEVGEAGEEERIESRDDLGSNGPLHLSFEASSAANEALEGRQIRRQELGDQGHGRQ